MVTSHSLASAFSALVVDPNQVDLFATVSALTEVGFKVSASTNYLDAKTLLTTELPLVLVTEIRLGAYNGLQLALRARSSMPRVSVIVTTGYSDSVLQRDAEQAGATFAQKPLSAAELLAAVFRTVLRQQPASGVIEPIRPPFERRRAERRQSAEEISVERRVTNRRRDIPGLLVRAAALS
jgi:DNA-binding NtrC family response regulator